MLHKQAIFIFIVFASCFLLGESGSDECDALNMYQCPSVLTDDTSSNTYGLVGNCMDCSGYHFADDDHRICATRNLFSKDEHYHYLGYDIAGIIVWFLTAGIATACGVGGGGIYVPLGILLLRFAGKSSSGLSQASIFGASLGGLMLNLSAKFPNTKITSSNLKVASDSQSSSPKYYTRPLIDYNMVLFLAPMEMGGATLGVLIQKVLPNWVSISVIVLRYFVLTYFDVYLFLVTLFLSYMTNHLYFPFHKSSFI
jgi:hypothetical protein